MSVLPSYQQPDVAANGFQIVAHGLQGKLRIVVGLAEVGQDKVLEPVMHHLAHHADGLEVGKMSDVAFDALFQSPVIRPVHQHPLIVVAL